MTAEPPDEAWSQLGFATDRRSDRRCVPEGGVSVVVQDVLTGPVRVEHIEATPIEYSWSSRPRADVVARWETGRVKVAHRKNFATIEERDQGDTPRHPSIGLWIDNCNQQADERVEPELDFGSIDELETRLRPVLVQELGKWLA